ncbi:uncharacterized protein LOC121380901 [Gigantopelta aegis]|uniref:uncharacterized protein LOC121380901 n=1 Tax=Gigantopelta aegis TaxID=1735272 RepID=UPI001B88C9E3|nr:uncharacterized protein LOC121380901 [Gigantopelta aegis]
MCQIKFILPADDDNVIELTRDGRVAEKDFLDVQADSKVAWESNRSPFVGAEIVRRARSKIGGEHCDLLLKNCEHFAKWCRYGYVESSQSKAAVAMGAVAFAPFALIAAGAVLVGAVAAGTVTAAASVAAATLGSSSPTVSSNQSKEGRPRRRKSDYKKYYFGVFTFS